MQFHMGGMKGLGAAFVKIHSTEAKLAHTVTEFLLTQQDLDKDTILEYIIIILAHIWSW